MVIMCQASPLNQLLYALARDSKLLSLSSLSHLMFFVVGFIRVRKASPLEESQFSWNPAPSPLDMQINAAFSHFSDKFVTPFQNVDGDDDLPSKIAKAKLEERRNKVEENKQKK